MSKEKIQKVFTDLFEKHKDSITKMSPEIISYKKVGAKTSVVFNDQTVGRFIAGYVTAYIHEEMENELAKIGYDVYDTDGCILHLVPTEKIFVSILWGSTEAQKENEPVEYLFDNHDQYAGFMHGVDEASGWLDYKIVHDDTLEENDRDTA